LKPCLVAAVPSEVDSGSHRAAVKCSGDFALRQIFVRNKSVLVEECWVSHGD